MLFKSMAGSVGALLLMVSVTGCGTGQMVQTAYGPMPDYCMGNNAAAGAMIGTLLGAAAGAAIGGGRGAAIGAGLGGVTGGVAGAQYDAQCRQLAAQRAMEMAVAQQAALIAQQEAYNRYGPVPITDHPVEYKSQDGHRHHVRVTSLNSFADPATRTVCIGGPAQDSDLDGKTSAAIGTFKLCKGADGKFKPA